MTRISRRRLAQLAAGVTVARAARLRAQAPAGPEYIGPLTGIRTGIEDRRFDPVVYTRALYATAPRRLRFQSRARDEAARWQKTLRSKLVELVGGFPAATSAAAAGHARHTGVSGYDREKIVFDSSPGVSVLGYLLLPREARRPLPVMICVPGHGRGVDDIVGIDEQGHERTDKAGYQHDFAIQIAEAGMAAMAIEPMGFGCRRDPVNVRLGLSRKACDPAAGGALLVGQSIIGWRVWDVIRTLDYLATRAELDHARMGCMGISGGGTVTLFSAALDSRIRAALVSGYLNTFRDSIGSLAHCIDNYVPGILNWAEMSDIAGLIAPRPLFVESGERDNIFPVAASIESFNEVRRIYSVFGALDRTEQEVFPGEHSFWGRRGIPFLAQHLGA